MADHSPDLPAANIPPPPRGLALFLMIGPAFVWMGEAIGSGEVILSTRFGAIFGTAVLWVPALAIFLKYWIGMSGARYTVCTGEGMMDMFARLPGPRNWAVWAVLLFQIFAGATSAGALAISSGTFANGLVPQVSNYVWSWIIVTIVLVVVWSGSFDALKRAMSLLVLLMIVGVGYVVIITFPGFSAVFHGLFGFSVPPTPAWAVPNGNAASASTWHEIAPIMGWAAGGFASQVWYTYWVLGAGYGMAHGRSGGKPADLDALSSMTPETAKRVRGWCRVVQVDASTALAIGTLTTLGFMLAGAAILHPRQIAPNGAQVAMELAEIFGSQWGQFGRNLFALAGVAALFSTLVGQLAGWPRLFADGFRICVPAFSRFKWKSQFRIFLVALVAVNIPITFFLQLHPVQLVKSAAFVEGVVLIPLQALAIMVALYFVLPKMLSKEARKILHPGPTFAVFLSIAAVIYLFFMVMKLIT